jgi:hypothetical protein
MILNLTQHPSTPEQTFAGVLDLGNDQHEAVKALLTFDTIPTPPELHHRAMQIAALAAQHADDSVDIMQAMIGGAPYLMPYLETALRMHHIQPLYAFTKRTVFERTLPDGTVSKRSFFRHEGFIRA